MGRIGEDGGVRTGKIEVSITKIKQVFESYGVPYAENLQLIFALLVQAKIIPHDANYSSHGTDAYVFDVPTENKLFRVELDPQFYYELAKTHTNLLEIYPDAVPVRYYLNQSRGTIGLVFASIHAAVVSPDKEIPYVELAPKK